MTDEMTDEDIPENKDNWKNRTQGMVCNTCVFYVPKRKNDLIYYVGRCRKNAPTMNGFPVVFTTDWCGSHRLDENKI